MREQYFATCTDVAVNHWLTGKVVFRTHLRLGVPAWLRPVPLRDWLYDFSSDEINLLLTEMPTRENIPQWRRSMGSQARCHPTQLTKPTWKQTTTTTSSPRRLMWPTNHNKGGGWVKEFANEQCIDKYKYINETAVLFKMSILGYLWGQRWFMWLI